MSRDPPEARPLERSRSAAMSIDVEDWFQVENLAGAFPRDGWRTQQLRVERNMDRLLAVLAAAPGGGVHATCFVLGWVADRCPNLVKRIADGGHEIGSHGYGHELVTRLSPDEFRDDVARAKAVLEDLTGREVRGYRAPSFSITPRRKS
jgi:polysaccharide deacetylase family protein (PEP-CTERM system associated)